MEKRREIVIDDELGSIFPTRCAKEQESVAGCNCDTEELDICEAYRYVQQTKQSLQHIRDNIDDLHLQWFKLARATCEAVEGDIPAVPRCCGRQRGRDNVPAHELEEYFKRSVTIPFLDHLVNELKQRFRSDQQCVVQGFILIPAVMKENPNWKKQVMGLASFYSNDFPSEENLDMLEIVCWETKWAAEYFKLPNDPHKTPQQCDAILFPNIHTLLRIVRTLPVTSCSCGLKHIYNPQWVKKE